MIDQEITRILREENTMKPSDNRSDDMLYHLAFIKDGKRLTLQMREDKDCLSPEVWLYVGTRITNPFYLDNNRPAILRSINKQYMEYFTSLEIDCE